MIICHTPVYLHKSHVLYLTQDFKVVVVHLCKTITFVTQPL